MELNPGPSGNGSTRPDVFANDPMRGVPSLMVLPLLIPPMPYVSTHTSPHSAPTRRGRNSPSLT